MNAVSEDVEKLVEKELEAANERFPQFHSPHEGWAVMQEEAAACEAIQVAAMARKYLDMMERLDE